MTQPYLWLNNGEPIQLRVGEQEKPTCNWSGRNGTPGNLTNAASYVYKDSADYSGIALTGSNSLSGVTHTGKTVEAIAGDEGSRYVYLFTIDIDGLEQTAGLQYNIIAKGKAIDEK